jgi:hypothetical protein
MIELHVSSAGILPVRMVRISANGMGTLPSDISSEKRPKRAKNSGNQNLFVIN